MNTTRFVRKPFVVEATEITRDNISEIADLIGTLREQHDGTPYILVDERLVPNVDKVYLGYWMTKMGSNIRCYSKRIFKFQFVETTPDIEKWIQFMNQDLPPNQANTQNVFDVEVSQQP